MTEIICFLAGAIIASAISIIIVKKWNTQSQRYMEIISGKDGQIRGYQVQQAYRDGLTNAEPLREKLMSENAMLIEQNRKLSTQLGDQSIFSNAFATHGGAAVMLRRSRSEGGTKRNE